MRILDPGGPHPRPSARFTRPGARLPGAPTTAARVCGGAVAVLGIVVLSIGWWGGIEPVRTIIPGLASMKANTALGFILAGASLVLLTSNGTGPKRLGIAFGGAVAALGFATALEYLGWDLAIDQLLAGDSTPSGVPGRPSPHTAVSFVLAGLALATIDVPRTRWPRPFSALLIGLAASTALAAVGYIYGVGYLHGSSGVTGMALHTMLAMLVLAIGIAMARPDQDPVATLLGRTPGGALARRLVLLVTLIVLAVGFARILSARAGLVDTEVGITLQVVAVITALVTVVFIMVRRLDAQVERDKRRLRTVIEDAHDAYVSIDAAGLVIEWNTAARETFGWTRADALGREFVELMVPEPERRAQRARIARFSSTGELRVSGRRFELELLHMDGHKLPVELTLSVMEGDDGATLSAFLRDISERMEREQERAQALDSAERAAHTDVLTGLPNRRALLDRLSKTVDHERRGDVPGTTWVAMLDLDRFKEYNDSNGHPAGDRLLREAGTAWGRHLRATDFLSRVGGEEFIVVLAESSEDAARAAIERLRAETPMHQTCSAGLVRWEAGESVEDMLARVDRALYDAKKAGRDRCVVAA